MSQCEDTSGQIHSSLESSYHTADLGTPPSGAGGCWWRSLRRLSKCCSPRVEVDSWMDVKKRWRHMKWSFCFWKSKIFPRNKQNNPWISAYRSPPLYSKVLNKLFTSLGPRSMHWGWPSATTTLTFCSKSVETLKRKRFSVFFLRAHYFDLCSVEV